MKKLFDVYVTLARGKKELGMRGERRVEERRVEERIGGGGGKRMGEPINKKR